MRNPMMPYLSIRLPPIRPTVRRQKMQAKTPHQWAGRALSALAVTFLLFDSVGKLLEVQPVIEGTLSLGYPRHIVFTLGIILLGCVLAYVVPQTAVLGALLLTAYLGGAVATQVRVEAPL